MNPELELISLHGTIPEELANYRLDQALAHLFPHYSRSQLTRWIQAGTVKIDGKALKPKDKVRAGQVVEIHATTTAQQAWVAQHMSLDIVHEDQDIIIVNKPAGLITHPGAGNPDHTLVNALLHRYPELAHQPRAGIVHRLDKDTSGLLVVARSLPAHTSLVQQLQARTLTREYQAIIQGTLIAGGTIEAPIGRHPRFRTKMAVMDNGREAITHYRVLARFKAHTHLQLQLETGRTHQIRVHLAHIQHPIVGDPAYGGRNRVPPNCSEALREILRHFQRQALHACHLSLQHPRSKELLSFTADLPQDMAQLLAALYNQ